MTWLLSLVFAMGGPAIEPGEYQISCMGMPIKENGENYLSRGYLLTIDKAGRASLIVPEYWPSRLSNRVESVQVIEDESGKGFILTARFNEVGADDKEGNGTSRNHVTITFNGEMGMGLVSQFGGAQQAVRSYVIKARIQRIHRGQ